MSIWSAVDNRLVALIQDNLGPGGSYPDLQVQQVLLGDAFRPEHLTYPAVLVVGDRLEPGDVYPHGDGVVHADDLRFAYRIIATTTDADYAQARADVQELGLRLFDLFRDRFALDGVADGPYRVREVHVRGLEVFVQSATGGVNGRYLGAAVLELDIMAEV